MATMHLKGSDMGKFDHLMDEVRAINDAWGYTGALDAIMYIHDHMDDYEDTRVLRELRAFMADGAKLFATKEPA